MKFFTLDWYHTPIDEADAVHFRRAYDSYAAHLELMRGVLPDSVLALARLSGMDDGLVVSVRHERAVRRLRLTLRCGDLQVGYYDLILDYEEASLSPPDEWTLARVARSTRSDARYDYDLAYHEIDRSEDGQIEHRLLFHPGIWLAIRCVRMRWEKVPRSDRRLPRSRDRFPGGPTAPPAGPETSASQALRSSTSPGTSAL
jgi:hypothetical protein